MRHLGPEISTDIGAAMRNVSPSVYVRIPFNVSDPGALDILLLRMKYKDGFVAWLNGTEVARRNAPAGAAVAFNAAAVAARPSGTAFEAEEVEISRYAALLQPGMNVLAIQGLNVSAADADFLLSPELIAGSSLQNRYFSPASAGAFNATGVSGFVEDTVFTPNRGFYDAPVDVTISCATPGATIVYTTDGSIPSLTNGTQSASPAVISVNTTTTLRAAAFMPANDLGPANTDTHTYLFVDHGGPAKASGGAAADFSPGIILVISRWTRG